MRSGPNRSQRCRIAAALALTVTCTLTAAQPRPTPADGAALATAAALQIERTLLDEDLLRYAELAAERKALASGLDELYQALDEALARTDTSDAREIIEQSLAEVETAQGEITRLRGEEHSLVQRLVDRLRRLALLKERIADLRSRRRARGGPLTGSWELTLLPANQHGTCSLEQTGTLVSGTYELEGGLSGSLQGTLIERKVHLVRIDSKLGRIMELEGYLSPDGNHIRGNWLRYELVGSKGANGQWSARRQSTEPE